MPTKREVLDQLKRDELLAAVDQLGLEVRDRRVRGELAEALAASRKAPLAEILGALPRVRLKEICRALALDDSGREKALLVERLAGPSPPGRPGATVEAPPSSSPRALPWAKEARTFGPSDPRKTPSASPPAAPLGFEAKLWAAADALRNNMDAAEYKHVVLGLIFLKYISDAFEAKHAELEAQRAEGADPEDADEYRAARIFWVPPEARWQALKANAPQPTIGTLVDDAMAAIERDNPSLKGVLPKDFGRAGLDKQRLGQIINLVSDIALGSAADRAKDTLGRVYDPCCGSGGMFVSSEKFIEAHSGKLGDISIYGQESNYTTWRLAKMNLAIRGIDAQIAHGDTFHNDKHPDLKADYVLANPPFNDSDWRGALLKDDKRWVYGAPPAGNANFAWVQHFIHHLAPTGLAGFVLANGSMSSNQSGEGEIRKNLIEADLVDCMVALPGQLFYSTQIPVCLWFLARTKHNGRFRDRRGETLFLDARKLGSMVDRTHRELTDADLAEIAGTYHAWCGDQGAGAYADVPGFCKSAKLEDIRKHGHVLTPGRYVGAAAAEEDGEPFEEKMSRLAATLREQQLEATKLDAAIAANLEELGYGG